MGSRRLRTLTALATAAAVAALTMAGASAASADPVSDDAPGTGQVNIVDKEATPETKSLFSYLNTTRGEQVLFGAQNTTTNGLTFSGHGDGAQSDVKGAVGDYPALFGFDTGDYLGYGPPTPAAQMPAAMARFTADIENASRLGAITTISAHLPNFATGGSFTDTGGRPVSRILPGGDKNADFNAFLDDLAAVVMDARDADGQPIPMILRPFHENTGNWFWWGAGHATTGEYKELFRYTVEYLRDTRDVHNLLYSFSPNGSFTGDESTYLTTYPGDPWVDILGYDAYEYNNDPANSDTYIASVVTDLAMISKSADARDKPAAFTEFGRNGDRTIQPSGNKSLHFFTDLLNGINADPDARRIAYMLTWVNWGNGQIYVPYAAYTDADGTQHPANELLPDFQEFYADDYTGFARDIPADALSKTGLTATSATPTLRVVTPADGVRITDAATTVRVKATVDRPTSVAFTVAGDPTKHLLTLGSHGYWQADWDIGADNLTNKSTEIAVVATYADGTTLSATSLVILGAAPVALNGVVDTFEGYGDNAALRGAYAFNNTTAEDLTLDAASAAEGTNGVRFAYDFGAKDYQGFGKTFTSSQDWSGFDQLESHLVPDGSNQKLVLQFNAGGATFEAYPSLTGTTPVDLKIRFSDFQDKAGTHPAPTVDQLKSVTQFYVYLNKTDSYTKPGSIGLDNIRATHASTPPGPTVIDVPPAPRWTDPCGPDNNGAFSGYTNTDTYTWKVIDHSTLNGKVGIVVTAKDGYSFPNGVRTRWTRTQDNTRCAATITATTTPQTCTAAGQSVPGSLTLGTTGIRSAYVYVGAKTGTKAGDLSALTPGPYLIIATVQAGYAFNDVPDGWKPSPSRDADGHVIKVSRVVQIAATDCDAAMITATPSPQTCTASGQSVPGSLTLDKIRIRSAYVYVGAKTGTKAGDLSALAPGPYLIIAKAEPGHWFTTVPDGWKASPSRDTGGHVVKVSRVVQIAASSC